MKTILIAAAAASLAMAAPAFADPGGHGHDKGHDKGEKHHDGQDRDDHQDAWGPPGLAKKPGHMPPGQYKKMYNRGQRLPTTYITQRYYVNDPQTYRLRTPPAGYRWVRVDDQYYLAQTRSGLISEVVSALLR